MDCTASPRQGNRFLPVGIILLAVFIFLSSWFIFCMVLQHSSCVCQCETAYKFNDIYRKEIIFIGFKLWYNMGGINTSTKLFLYACLTGKGLVLLLEPGAWVFLIMKYPTGLIFRHDWQRIWLRIVFIGTCQILQIVVYLWYKKSKWTFFTFVFLWCIFHWQIPWLGI